MAHRDLETGNKLPLKISRSWTSRLLTAIPNTGFRRPSLSPSRGLSHPHDQELEKCSTLTSEERKRQNYLLQFLVGGITNVLEITCEWYSSYLQSKFKLHWHLLAPILVGLDSQSLAPGPGDLVIVYNFVIAVAKLLKSTKDVAVVSIVDWLDNEGMLKQQLDEERAIPNQAVFAALGWLTMLYEAAPDPKSNKLEVNRTSTSVSGYRNPLNTRKYCAFKQGFDYIDGPFYRLLNKFGDLIPEAPTPLPYDRGLEVIKVQSVCFNTLHNLCEFKIEWVTSLALHLELDSGKKTLKLFQFPSFCRMMLAAEGDNVLSRLLNDHASMASEDVTEPDVPSDEFFEEILLSYRLIFGQDDRSWRDFSRMTEGQRELSSHPSQKTEWNNDPLLIVLCGQSSETAEARQVYDEIKAHEPTSNYVPHAEFRFFGKRLLELQDFVKQHQPKDVRSLLSDRRDITSWYALWNNQALLIFATMTILLMIVSLIVQIWQVKLAQAQLQQSQPQ